MDGVDVTNLSTFLAWLAGPVGLAAVAFFISDFLRNLTWEAWVTLAGSYKTAIIVALYALVGAGAYALVTYVPADVITAIQPFWQQAVYLYIAGRGLFAVSQAAEARRNS